MLYVLTIIGAVFCATLTALFVYGCYQQLLLWRLRWQDNRRSQYIHERMMAAFQEMERWCAHDPKVSATSQWLRQLYEEAWAGRPRAVIHISGWRHLHCPQAEAGAAGSPQTPPSTPA